MIFFNKRYLQALLCLGVTSLLFSGVAGAATINVGPGDSAWFRYAGGGGITDNNGNHSQILVGNNTNQGPIRSALSFDLSGVTLAVGEVVTGVELRLVRINAPHGTGETIQLYEANSFVETTVNWQNFAGPGTAPDPDTEISGFTGLLTDATAGAANTTTTFGSTAAFISAANAQIGSGTLHLGLKIDDEVTNVASLARWHSDDASLAGDLPSLIITTAPIPEASSIVFLGIGGLGLLLHRRK